MRMMHESRLWVSASTMIKVLMRIRLLEVLVVHLRHRVEESGIVVVVLLLLLINRPARGRRCADDDGWKLNSSISCFFVVWSPQEEEKTKRRV